MIRQLHRKALLRVLFRRTFIAPPRIPPTIKEGTFSQTTTSLPYSLPAAIEAIMTTSPIIDGMLSDEPMELFSNTPEIVNDLSILVKESLQLSNEYKSIVLAAPHPGSTLMLQKMVEFVAGKLDADVVTLDYSRIVELSEKPLHNAFNEALRVLLDKPNNVTFTDSFNPGPLNLAENEDYDDFEEDEEEDLENGAIPSYPYENRNGSDRPPTKEKSFVLEMIKNNTGIPTIRVSLRNGNPENMSPTTDMRTHYSAGLSKALIESFAMHLRDEILDKHKINPNKKVILFLSDLTDLMTVPLDCGKKIIIALMHIITDLRINKKIQAILIFGSSPPLSDADVISKDDCFYMDFFKGSKPLVSTGSSSAAPDIDDLLTDGTLFKSCLDRAHDFHKIPVYPPTIIYNNLRRTKLCLDVVEVDFLNYIKQMRFDLKQRLRGINISNLLSFLTLKGFKADLNVIVTGEKPGIPSIPEDYSELIGSLETGIWPISKTHKLALHAIEKSRISSPHSHNISIVDFLEALAKVYETDLTRLSNMDPDELFRTVPIGDDSDSAGSALNSDPTIITTEAPVQPQKPVVLTHEESIASQLKKKEKLNSYEKKLMSTIINPSSMKITMDDLVLAPKTKQILQTLVTLPILHPKLFKTGILSRSSINGVLMFGPPGTGKTMLAKAIAKSSGANFMSVSLSDIYDKYVGEGEKNVRAVFTLARKLSPCVVFLDEVDALFGARKQNENSSSKREIMNEFMAEWDGLASNNNGVVVLGATNRPFDLDDAILRRMPRRVLIDLPSEEARLKILQVHLEGEELDSVDLAAIAKQTNLYSGSDLKNMCVAAALYRIKEDLLIAATKQDPIMKDASHAEIMGKVGTMIQEVTDLGKVCSNMVILPSKLNSVHFENAMKEVGPSLTDEMATLVDLRKWDTIYGDNAKQKLKPAWGFGKHADDNAVVRSRK